MRLRHTRKTASLEDLEQNSDQAITTLLFLLISAIRVLLIIYNTFKINHIHTFGVWGFFQP